MEFCGHCRALRKTRKSSRTRTVRKDGATVTMKVDSYQCAQCGHLISSSEAAVAPAGRPSAATTEPAPGEPTPEATQS